MTTKIMVAAVVAVLGLMPIAAQAQGIGQGAADGANTGGRVAGPVGAVVGGVVGGAVGGAVGGVKGVLGIPQRSGYPRHYWRGRPYRHHRRYR